MTTLNLWLSKTSENENMKNSPSKNAKNENMKNFTAGTYKQQREYKSFSPSFINRRFTWENPQIDLLVEQSANLLGELKTYAEIIPDVNFSVPMSIAKEAIDSNLIEGTNTELYEVVLPQFSNKERTKITSTYVCYPHS